MNRTLARLLRELALPAEGTFDDSLLRGLDAPVARYFRTAIAPGTPLARTALVEMRGRIRLNRWVDFRAQELITPSAGFVWAARAGAISGDDRYVSGRGAMRWKLLGLVPVMRAGGADISRSAAARVVGEGFWVPTALLPRDGVEWRATGADEIAATHRLDAHVIEVRHRLDGQGCVQTSSLERWGDPERTGTFAAHPFGVETTDTRSFGGVTIPSAGRAGWHFGTERWEEGVFFEYELTRVDPFTEIGTSAG